MTQPPLLVTAYEAAAALHVSRRTFDRWRRSGRCPLTPITVGKRVLFSVRQLERYTSVTR